MVKMTLEGTDYNTDDMTDEQKEFFHATLSKY